MNDFTAFHYDSRAQDYVTSAVHSSGADLDEVEALVRGQSAARVLDLGCGGGHVSYRAAPHVASVVACDLTAGMLQAVAATAAERGLGNIAVRQAPAEALPFEDGAFDIVLCRYTTHHWSDMEGGLREARRVTAPGGRALFIDAVAADDPVLDTHLQAIELLRDPSHARNATVPAWVAALGRAGWHLDGVSRRVLRMEFPVWIARTHPPAVQAEAIRSLLAAAPPKVREHFRVGEDGSFDLEAASFFVHPA